MNIGGLFKRSGSWDRRSRLSCPDYLVEPKLIKLIGIAEYDLFSNFGRHAGKILADSLHRLWEGGVRVREIRRPHIVVFAEEFPSTRSQRIVLESCPDVAPDIFARLHRQPRTRITHLGINVVKPMHPVREPTHVVLR